MPERNSFDYAILRLVPRVERGEYINVGAVVFCRTRRYLAAMVHLDIERARALAPELDLDEAQRHLEVVPIICDGGPAAGPIGALTMAERFHWLVAPRSAIIQPSPVHCGLCDEPARALSMLMESMVLVAESR